MNIQGYITYNGMTVTRFARMMGISRAYVYDLMNRKHYPSRKLARKIELRTQGKIPVVEIMFPWGDI